MAKSEETLKLEREIWNATRKQGVFGCFEVTIGWFGKERVDYMTYDTNHIFRCYEIKVSKADFRSKAHNTFLGHYNYYVMPLELYNEVAKEIPDGIGVYCGDKCVKRPKMRVCINAETLKDSLLRSLHREAEKIIKSETPSIVEALTRRAKQAEQEANNYRRMYWDLQREVQAKYGTRWNKESEVKRL
jgi:hypothetical protein